MNEVGDDGDPHHPVTDGERPRARVLTASLAGLLVVFGAGGVLFARAGGDEEKRNRPAASPASPSHSPSPTPTPAAKSKPRPPADLIRKTKDSARLPFNVEQIAAQVAKVRGLTFRRPVRVTVLTKKRWDKLFRPGKAGKQAIAQEETLLESLGLVPEGVNLSKLQTTLRPSSTTGLYITENKRLYLRVASDLPRAFREATVAHELAHALQDQELGLSASMTETANVENYSALSALVEGDAMRTEGLWSNRFQSKKERRTRARINRISKRTFEAAFEGSASAASLDFYTFPYVDGLRFVRAIIDRRGMKGLNEAFEQPPYSTEGVLHPHIYLSGEGREKPLVTLPSSRWKQAFLQRYGELEVRQIFANLGPGEAAKVASGWDGAEIHVYKSRGETATVMHLVYDNRREARQACRAMPRWYSLISGGSSVSDQVMRSAGGWMARSCPDMQLDVGVAPTKETALQLVGGAAKDAVP